MSLRVQSVGILALIVGLVSAAHLFDSGGFLSDDQVDNTDNLVKENNSAEMSFEPVTIIGAIATAIVHFGGGAHVAAHGMGHLAHAAGQAAHGAGQVAAHGAGHLTIHALRNEIGSEFLRQLSDEIDRHNSWNTRAALNVVSLWQRVMSAVTEQTVRSILHLVSRQQAQQMCRDAARAVSEDPFIKDIWRDLTGGYYSLVQVPTSPVDQENPGAGFDGAYSGNQAESKGLVGPLEVIKSDSERTIQMKKDAEKQQAADLVEYEQNNQAIIGKKSTKKTLDNEAA